MLKKEDFNEEGLDEEEYPEEESNSKEKNTGSISEDFDLEALKKQNEILKQRQLEFEKLQKEQKNKELYKEKRGIDILTWIIIIVISLGLGVLAYFVI